MNKKQVLPFLIFIFPCYFGVLVLSLALFLFIIGDGINVWQELSFYGLIILVLGCIVTGAFLTKKVFWVSIFMIISGVYLVHTSHNYPFVFELISLYGYYIIVHFSLCSLYVFITRKKVIRKQSSELTPKN